MKKYLSFFAIATLVLAFGVSFIAGSVQAADFMAPKENDEEGRISTNREDTYENFYVVGGDITVNSKTNGDLYAAGGWVSVENAVEQDIVAAGGTVVISEPVNGDVRVAGGKVTINAPVKGDVLAGAGTLVITDKGSVGGELRAAGGVVEVNGPVVGGAYLMGEKVRVNSKIDGEVKITSAEEMTFGPKAEVASVSYLGKKAAVVENGGIVNTINFTELEQHNRDKGKRTGFLGFLLGGFIIKFFAVLIAGLIALRLFRGQLQTLTANMLAKPWHNLAVGFITSIVVPVAMIIALVVIVGYYVAMMTFVLYILFMMVAGLLASIFLGAWLVKVLTKKSGLVLDWQAVVIGIVVLMLLRFIPVVGWLICAIVFLMAFGALVNHFRQYLNRSKSSGGAVSGGMIE